MRKVKKSKTVITKKKTKSVDEDTEEKGILVQCW